MSSIALWLAVGALGGLGAVARFLLDAAVTAAAGRRFPFGTLLVNVSGAAVLGVLLGAGLHGDAYLLAGTAAVGSYTTFSTWMFDTRRLAGRGRPRLATLNVALSLALGLAALELGRLIAGG